MTRHYDTATGDYYRMLIDVSAHAMPPPPKKDSAKKDTSHLAARRDTSKAPAKPSADTASRAAGPPSFNIVYGQSLWDATMAHTIADQAESNMLVGEPSNSEVSPQVDVHATTQAEAPATVQAPEALEAHGVVAEMLRNLVEQKRLFVPGRKPDTIGEPLSALQAIDRLEAGEPVAFI